MTSQFKLKSATIALLLFGSSSAFATGSIFGGETTNNNQTYNQGGQGGNATAIAGALAGAGASNHTDVDVKNTNLNTNLNTNKQGQAQAQKTENANNSSQSTTVQGDTTVFKAPDIPVSTAYAPSMSPSAQCMGVASGGVQGMSIGISFGKSYESKPCNQRELARMFAQMGNTKAATQVLCSIEGADVITECQKPVDPVALTIDNAPVAKITKAEPSPVINATQIPVISSNGYYSVVTNPLGQ